MLLFAIALAGSAFAQDQTVNVGQSFVDTNRLTATLTGCTRESASVVRCDFTLTAEGKDRGGTYRADAYTAFLPNGAEIKGSKLKFGPETTYKNYYNGKVRPGITYPLSIRFEGVPQGVTSLGMDVYSFRTLETNSSLITRIQNIAITNPTPTISPKITNGTTISYGTQKVTFTNCTVKENVTTCTATVR